MTKAEKEANELKFQKLSQRKAELEQHPLVKAYLKWIDLDPSAKNTLRQKWNQYYKDLKNTRAYVRYQQQHEAYDAGKMKDVMDLAAEAKAQMFTNEYELTKPSSYDPDLLEQSMYVRAYLRVIDEMERLLDLSNQVSQAKGLFSNDF